MGVPAIVKSRVFLLGIAALGVLLAAGLTHNSATNATAQAPAASGPPAVAVDVLTMAPRNVRLWSSFSGRLHSVDFAEIRPEVGGRIASVRIKDGQLVKAGEVLFVIEPGPYEAALAKAQANLASAKSNAEFAKTEFERAVNMIKTQAIAQRVYDDRNNSDKVARAAVLSAEAEIKQAQIDLDHAYVKAPISGRISRAEITLGNLVQAGSSAPLLTSIASNDGIYADFEVDEQTYMQRIRAHADGQNETLIPVEMTVQGDEGHPVKGTIYSFDNRLDTASGTIRARAKFDNKDGALVPGMFCSIKLASSGDHAVLLVPDRAIGNDQNKRFVFVVGADNKVVYREVRLGDQVAGARIVLSGVAAGDRVIVDGTQHVRPDMVVNGKEVALDPQ